MTELLEANNAEVERRRLAEITIGANKVFCRELEQRVDMLKAALEHAINHHESGLAWLRSWFYGDAEAMAELEARMAQEER